jgi:6-phosphogluconolactonase
VVTVKGTNWIYVFPVGLFDGRPGSPIITKAKGPTQPTYFGFAFDFLDRLIVAEPFGATATIPAQPDSAVSSFGVDFNGMLRAISSDVTNGQGLSCWVVLAGQYVYISDNGTGGTGGIGNISTYKEALNGSLSLVAGSAAEVSRPNDMAVAPDGFGIPRFLYVLESGSGSVGAFGINADGSLTLLQAESGLPVSAGAQGLAAY